MPRTNLAVRVAGSVFGIAGEMRRLPAYFDNPGSVNHKASISKGVSGFSFIFIGYLLIDMSSSTIKKIMYVALQTARRKLLVFKIKELTSPFCSFTISE